MIRLHAVVEGQTEETFVNKILASELGIRGVFMDARRITIGRRRDKRFKGGFIEYEHLKNDLLSWMKQDYHSDARFTTMVDLYRLPEEFPGYHDCKHQNPMQRVVCLEQRLGDDIGDRRLIPYVQLHEFEALLFSDVQQFLVAFPEESNRITTLETIRNEFESPEHINDRPDLSPSNRILAVFPQYSKTVAGLLIIQQIGLAQVRKACSHFDGWMRHLEELAQ